MYDAGTLHITERRMQELNERMRQFGLLLTGFGVGAALIVIGAYLI